MLLVRGLKHNLLSISQLCDKGYKVIFEADHCAILDKISNEIKFFEKRHKNIYLIDLKKIPNQDLCLVANVDDLAGLWHRRLSHASYGVISKLARRDLIIGLPKTSYIKAQVYSACAHGKMTRTSFKSKDIVTTSRALDLLTFRLIWTNSVFEFGRKKVWLRDR